ncbi:MAG TPA: MFS transporter [Gammaproteobacteria bacterium]|nr:MFS transporter [Gammaproteobacteria bacterium]
MSASFRENPPLNGDYWPTLAVVLLALCPHIVVTTAWHFLTPAMGADLGSGTTILNIAEGLSDAGYACGAVIAGYLIQRFPQRSGFLAAESLCVAGFIISAVAPAAPVFAAGRILQGLATGFLLVFAVPPLVTRFPAERLPLSAAAINIAFFGAVTAGPLIGAVVAPHLWRWLFAALGGLGFTGLVVSAFAFPLQGAHNPDQPPDWPAFLYALLGTALPFYAVSRLGSTVSFGSLIFWLPMAIGLACLFALVVTQYRSHDGLIPMHKVWHAVPLAGTLAAMAGGAAYVAFLLIDELFLEKVLKTGATAAGLAQWPGVIALVAAALIFYRLFRTRYLPHFVVAGMALLIAAGAALVTLHTGTSTVLLLGVTAALGAGAGATVSPGLFVAAMAVEASFLGRVFALVELVRSEADFLIGPTLQHVAMLQGKSGAALAAGLRRAAGVMLGVLILAVAAMIAIYINSGARPHRPNLEAWLNEGGQALSSAAARLRRQR